MVLTVRTYQLVPGSCRSCRTSRPPAQQPLPVHAEAGTSARHMFLPKGLPHTPSSLKGHLLEAAPPVQTCAQRFIPMTEERTRSLGFLGFSWRINQRSRPPYNLLNTPDWLFQSPMLPCSLSTPERLPRGLIGMEAAYLWPSGYTVDRYHNNSIGTCKRKHRLR